MDERAAYLVDVFTTDPGAGTVAGVLPEAAGLAADQRRTVARELGAEATAFLSVDGNDGHELLVASPGVDPGREGTAALAARAVVDRLSDPATVETGVGRGELSSRDDGTVWLTTGEASVRTADVDPAAVADALAVDVATLRDVGADVPTTVASVGTPVLAVPVNYFEHLSGARPDPAGLEAVLAEFEADVLVAYTFDTLAADCTAHARVFRPDACRPEVTPTVPAAGALGASLRRHAGLADGTGPLLVGGGHFLDRPGHVGVETDGFEVAVGGETVTSLAGSVTVPSPDEDGIREA